MGSSSRPRPTAGFTLIELMIVIAILGLLAAVLLPNILGAQDASNETDTESMFIQLDHAAGAFERKHGIYPPADLKMPDKSSKLAKAVEKWKPDNGRNTGIESFVAFVSQDRRGGTDLSVLGDNLSNTDNDKHGAELTLLGRTERLEIADAWRTPIAYFDRFSIKKPQTMVSFTGETMEAAAARGEGGKPLGGKKYQFLSAGKDGTFGTADDQSWPKN